jgi:hypothetical protein
VPFDVSIYFLTDTMNVFVYLFQTVRNDSMIITVLSSSRLNQSDDYPERTSDQCNDDRRIHKSQG